MSSWQLSEPLWIKDETNAICAENEREKNQQKKLNWIIWKQKENKIKIAARVKLGGRWNIVHICENKCEKKTQNKIYWFNF